MHFGGKYRVNLHNLVKKKKLRACESDAKCKRFDISLKFRAHAYLKAQHKAFLFLIFKKIYFTSGQGST